MKEKLEKELADYKRKLAAAQKNNLTAGIIKAEKEIARIEKELQDLENIPSPEKTPISIVKEGAKGNGKPKLKSKKKKSALGKTMKQIVEQEDVKSVPIIDSEKKWKHDSKVIKHSDEHYIVLYAGDTKNDAEVKFVDGQWELICKQVKDYPKFKKSQVEEAINFVLDLKHFIATRDERMKNAKVRNEIAKKNANKPDSKKAEEAVEKAAEKIEEKVDDIIDDGKKVPKSTADSIILDVKSIVKAVKSGMEAEQRKKFINKLINELKKLL